MLIRRFFAEKILFTALLAKRYLTHGLEIRKIYEFIQYALEKTFKNFDLEIAEARHEGDKSRANQFLVLLQNWWVTRRILQRYFDETNR